MSFTSSFQYRLGKEFSFFFISAFFPELLFGFMESSLGFWVNGFNTMMIVKGSVGTKRERPILSVSFFLLSASSFVSFLSFFSFFSFSIFLFWEAGFFLILDLLYLGLLYIYKSNRLFFYTSFLSLFGHQWEMGGLSMVVPFSRSSIIYWF